MKTFASGVNVRRALIAVAAIYILISLYNWYFHVNSYGVIYMDDDKDAVRYALGPPARADVSDRVWTYNLEANATLTTTFGANALLDRVACASPSAEPASCPELYGIGIGESEDVVVANLGNPSYIRIVGDRKYLTYVGIGATYVLQRFVVTGLVRETRRGSFLDKSWKFLRNLVYLPGGIG
jgi:hypothetical protein